MENRWILTMTTSGLCQLLISIFSLSEWYWIRTIEYQSNIIRRIIYCTQSPAVCYTVYSCKNLHRIRSLLSSFWWSKLLHTRHHIHVVRYFSFINLYSSFLLWDPAIFNSNIMVCSFATSSVDIDWYLRWRISAAKTSSHRYLSNSIASSSFADRCRWQKYTDCIM